MTEPDQPTEELEKMTAEVMRNILGWSALINYGVLLVWFLFFVLAHDWMYRLHTRYFALTAEKFDSVHYASMATFKLLVIVLNLVPYLAMRIVV
jgi:hypothetical protein